MAAPSRGHARPHVGRSRELSQTLRAVAGGDGGGAILAGVAGVGKSHLLDLVVDDLTGDGWAPLLAHGDPTRPLPFGAFGDLLPPLTGEPDRWAVVLHAGLEHLVDRAGVGNPVLVADDLHAFDPASAALVQQAVLDRRVRLVGTLRVGDPAPDAVTALWKDDLVERIDLVALERSESTELAEKLVGGPIDGQTLVRLWDWTEGNPLLLTEIVEHARDNGDWQQVSGLWQLAGAPAQSPRLAALLEQRVAVCPPAVADLVDAVALAGRLPITVADALVGRKTIAEAERARLVRVRQEHGRIGVALDHPLYGELRRAAAPPERQADLRHRLIDVVEAGAGELRDEDEDDDTRGLGAADQALVAQWYLETGRVGARTAEMLLAAAERAWAGNDPERAAMFARRSWELEPVDRSGHLLVSALVRIGDIDGLDGLAGVAPRIVAAATTDRVRTVALLAHAVAVFQFANRPDEARRILRDGAAHVEDAGWRDILLVEEASFDLQMGNVREAEARALPRLDSPNPRAAADAASVVAPARALQGRIAESVAAAERGLELANSLLDDFVDVGQHLFHLLTAMVDDGRVTEAEAVALEAVENLTGPADRFSTAFLRVSLGRIYRMRGRPVTAARHLHEAAAAFESVERIGFTGWALAGLAGVRAEVGDLDGARAAVARFEGLRDHPIGIGVAESRRALAWVHVAAGDLDAAVAGLSAAAAHGLAAGELVHAGHALHDMVRLGQATSTVDQLRELAAGSDSTFLQICADRASASAASDPAGLASVAARLEELGCDLMAAEAWNEALACGLAEVSTRQAGVAGRQFGLLRRRCEGARTPLLDLRAAVEGLSLREREIASLTASGLGRRQIAERFFISTRTVDSHLQRIYAKLGVSGRDGLRRVLGDPD